MNSDGIVLLDPAHQRALYSSNTNTNSIRSVEGTNAAPPPRQRYESQESHTTTSSNGTGKQSFATLGSAGKQSIATLGSSPRTNFTTRHIEIPPTHVEGLHEGGDNDPWMFEVPRDSTSSSSTVEKHSQDMSMKLVLGGVVLGFCLGVVFQFWKISPVAAQWVALPCTLFLRALQCVVMPYVFCSVAVAVGDIVFVGKISIIGRQTAKIFIIFWLASTTMGMAVALMFRPLFHTDNPFVATPLNAMGMRCRNNGTLTMSSNATVFCAPTANATILPPAATFVVHDINNLLKTTAAASAGTLSLGDLLYMMIMFIVPANVFTAFVRMELISLISFAMVLGAIAGKGYFNKTRRVNYLYLFLLQLRDTLFLMMEWVIALTPLVLVSFIASFMAANADNLDLFRHAAYYVLAIVIAATLQLLLIYPLIVFLMTRCNPYNHMKQMVRAYVFAFACASSVATMPVTLSCIKRARVCSQSLSNFVVSIGASSNTSAMGFYLPIAIVFLAETTGEFVEITAPRLAGLFAISLVLCVGTPPIPAAGLGVTQLAYLVLFGVTEMPPAFMLLIAVDFIVDRFATVCNVNDDIMAVKIIAENTDETVAQEHLGERM